MGKLVACPSCSAYVRANESTCPLCDARLRNERGVVIRTAGAVLMGLSLTACPADDDTNDTEVGSSATASGSTSDAGTTSSTGDPDPSSSSFGGAEYGVAETGDFTTSTGGVGTSTGGSSSGSDTDTGSTSLGDPDYGVPETSG